MTEDMFYAQAVDFDDLTQFTDVVFESAIRGTLTENEDLMERVRTMIRFAINNNPRQGADKLCLALISSGVSAALRIAASTPDAAADVLAALHADAHRSAERMRRVSTSTEQRAEQ